jgi:hypothetical protein
MGAPMEWMPPRSDALAGELIDVLHPGLVNE